MSNHSAVLLDDGVEVGIADLDLSAITGRVDTSLMLFLSEKARDAELGQFAELLRECLRAGGKRIRPLLCVLGWQAAGGGGDAGLVYRWAASVELFHLFALIHDDVMDDSATRRGRPTVHRMMTARHPHGVGGPAADGFGRNSAILIGDLALVWAEEMLHTGHQAAAARRLMDQMRAEVMAGQYLDLAATGRMGCPVADVVRIAQLKTAKYTVERPLQIGAALGGADGGLLRHCSAFAMPLGEAFQMRDDLLGVFGDPLRSGKPVLDDLREGSQPSCSPWRTSVPRPASGTPYGIWSVGRTWTRTTRRGSGRSSPPSGFGKPSKNSSRPGTGRRCTRWTRHPSPRPRPPRCAP